MDPFQLFSFDEFADVLSPPISDILPQEKINSFDDVVEVIEKKQTTQTPHHPKIKISDSGVPYLEFFDVSYQYFVTN